MSGRTTKATAATLWIVFGASFVLRLAGMLSFGLFTMPLAVAGAIIVLVRPSRVRGLAVGLCALANGPLLIAWFNRDGPGRVCRNFPPDGLACSDQLNPWPWLAGAVICLALAVPPFVLAARRARS